MELRHYYSPDPAEKPLENLVSDGGFVGIFRRIAFVGDSLSSGEFEAVAPTGKRSYHDMFDYSWGQYICRACGSFGYNFSRGGMTAKEYCESFAEANGFWDEDKACQAYVIALGVNDVINQHQTIGSVDDICREDYTQNAPTFTGYYAQIIQRYKKIQPHARFFLVSMVHWCQLGDRREDINAHRDALNALAAYFDHTYVIDLADNLPPYDKNFDRQYSLHGHLNPMGYIFTAKVIASYMDYIIRHNMPAFRQAAFIGTPMYDPALDV